jgi:hypothetical protein
MCVQMRQDASWSGLSSGKLIHVCRVTSACIHSLHVTLMSWWQRHDEVACDSLGSSKPCEQICPAIAIGGIATSTSCSVSEDVMYVPDTSGCVMVWNLKRQLIHVLPVLHQPG